MFGTIRRHQTWLWIIIAGVTIISFIVYFGPNGNKMLDTLGRSSQVDLGSIDGQAITRQQYAKARNEVYFQYFLENHQWPDHANAGSRFNEALETYKRLFFIQKEQELGIEINSKLVADRARQMLGNSSPDEFAAKTLNPEGLDLDDFERFIRHDLAMQQLYMTAAVSGTLVTPQEADTLYRNEHQDLVTSAVFFSATNYLTNVTFTPAQISQFYTNELANYRIPKRVEVTYVKYNITNYLAAARNELTNLDQIIDRNFRQYVTNAESRVKLKEELTRDHARKAATKDANAFAVRLDEMPPGTNRTANLAALAATNGLTVQTLAPFDGQKGPEEIDVPAEFSRIALKLTSDEPFSPPIPADDGVYVLAWKRTLPSEIPPLTSIEAQVTKDYRTAKATQMAQEASIKFDAAVTNGLAQGKTFAAICAETRVKPEPLPPFSLSTQTLPDDLAQRLNLRMLKQAAFSTPPGKASPPIPARGGGCIVYVEKKLPIDEVEMKKELSRFLVEVRQGRQSDAFNRWFQKQINRDPAFGAVLQRAAEETQMKQGGSRSPNS